jgi:transposase
MVSRDGSSEYASARKYGAPQARQVSDRWHLTKNLAEGISVQMAQSLGKLRRRELAQAKAAAEEKQRDEQQHPVQTQAMPPAQRVRQVERGARYEQMMRLREQGLKNADIAAQMGITARTVQRGIASGDIPSSRPRKPRSHLIDP